MLRDKVKEALQKASLDGWDLAVDSSDHFIIERRYNMLTSTFDPDLYVTVRSNDRVMNARLKDFIVSEFYPSEKDYGQFVEVDRSHFEDCSLFSPYVSLRPGQTEADNLYAVMSEEKKHPAIEGTVASMGDRAILRYNKSGQLDRVYAFCQTDQKRRLPQFRKLFDEHGCDIAAIYFDVANLNQPVAALLCYGPYNSKYESVVSLYD